MQILCTWAISDKVGYMIKSQEMEKFNRHLGRRNVFKNR